MDKQITDLSRKNKRNRILTRLLSLTCAVVMLLTMNSLKLTAQTLSRTPTCGYVKHTHASDCYDSDGNLVCGKTEHVHTDACYQVAPGNGVVLDDDVEGETADPDEPVDEIILDLDDSLDMDGDLDAEPEPASDEASQDEASIIEETPEFVLGEKAPLSRIVDEAGIHVDLKTIVEVGVVDYDGQQADLIHVQPEEDDYIIKALRDFDEVELALVLENEVMTVRLIDGRAAADELIEAQEPGDGVSEQPKEQPADGPADQITIPEDDASSDDQPADQMPTADMEEPGQPTNPAEENAQDEDRDPPIAVNAEPGDGDAAPAEGEQSNQNDGDAAPAEGEQPEQNDGDAAPVEGEQPNQNDGDAAPIEGEQPNQNDGDAAPAEEGTEVPAVEEEQPAAGNADPEDEQDAAQAADVPVAPDAAPVVMDQQQVDGLDQQPAEDEAAPGQPSEDEAAPGQPSEDEAAPESTEEAQDQSQEEAQGEWQAIEEPGALIDLSDVESYPLSLRALVARSSAAPRTEDAADTAAPEDLPIGEWTIEYDANVFAITLVDDDYSVMPLVSFDSADIRVNGMVLNLVNCTWTDAPDEAEVEARQESAVYTATIDLSAVTEYPLSLNDLMAQATLVSAVEPEDGALGIDALPEEEAIALAEDEQPEAIDYDSALLAIEEAEDDHLVTPIAAFESTVIAIDNGSRYELTLVNYAPASEAAEPAYPAQHFDGGTQYVAVIVDAPEGAFPENTTMTVTDVEDERTLADISDVVAEDFVEVTRVHAVDITFHDADGNEIEPLAPISVVMSVPEVQEEEAPVVVHVDNEGATSVVSAEEQPALPAAGEQPEAQPDEGELNGSTVAFTADSFSVYAVVMAKTIETRFMDARGETWNISVAFTKEANIPATASLKVEEVTSKDYLERATEALEAGKRVTEAYFFDIKIIGEDGREIQPDVPVEVNISLSDGAEAVFQPENTLTEDSGDPVVCAIHITEDETAVWQAMETADAVTFDAASFSVWGVVYTVDFHWIMGGRTFDYSMPGGGFIRLSDLFAELGIAPAAEALDMAREVASVEFNAPELLRAIRANGDTSVSALLEALGLEPEYTAEMTDEVREALGKAAISDGDWALISLKPFASEETLTFTMTNGESFTIRVTDAIVSEGGLVNGKSYILYAVNPYGQYYALRGDGYTYQIPNNDLDSLTEDYSWRYERIDPPAWNGGTGTWWSHDNAYRIELWYWDDTAVYDQYGSYVSLVSAPNGGYYFITGNGDYGTYALWLYNDTDNPQVWRFVVGDANQYNRSEIFIYEKNTFTVNVDNAAHGKVYLNDTDGWVTAGLSYVNRNGYNLDYVYAMAEDGWWFDHWELDGQRVSESDAVGSTVQDGYSYGYVAKSGLSIGSGNDHVLRAVFTPETSFNVEANPSEGGYVDKNTSIRTKDGYNKEEITATAQLGWWFGHWEIDGEKVPEDSYTIDVNGDGLSICTLPARSLQIGDGETLTAVFIRQITYNVEAVPETEGANIPGCMVQIGESAEAASLTRGAMTRQGYNVSRIVAHAGPGYVFRGWLLDDEPILGGAEIESALDGSGSTIAANTLQVCPDVEAHATNPTHTVKAVFAQEYNFTVTTYPAGGGTVQDGDKAEAAGPTIYASMTKDGHNKYDITATPASGYYLSHWTMNGQPMVEGEGENQHYLYTNGVIPEEVLDLTSSDNICAVFVKNVYAITVKIDDSDNNNKHGSTSIGSQNGDKNDKTCLTSNVPNSVKQASDTIHATQDYYWKFAYWRVDTPHDAVVDWGEGKTLRSQDIQPYVNSDATLTAMFVYWNTRVFTVTVDDPSHGTVWGPDVSGNNCTDDKVGLTAYVAKTENNKNKGKPEVRTAAQGYEFLGWNLYQSDGTTLVASYLHNTNQGNALKKWQLDDQSVQFDYDDMVLKAMFKEKDPPPAFDDPVMEDLSDWAEGISGTKFSSEKTAEVFDYDNRIYRIQLSASSEKQAIDSSVVINFITDTSRSMYFPANITQVNINGVKQTYGNNNNGGEDRLNQLANWLYWKDRSNVYYIIGKQNINATLYAVYHDGSNWVYVDASYYTPNADDGMTRTGKALNGNGGSDFDKAVDDYKIYQAPARVSGKPWSRLDYLEMSVETAVKVIYEICPNAQIDLTTFNRSATYKGTIPNNTAAIEQMLRNIDVAGGTRQDLGLAEAMKHFTNGSAKKQVAVLITDGAPNSGMTSVPESNIKAWAETNAAAMKQIRDAEGNALELYTMGLSLDNNTKTFMEGLATGSSYAKSVNSGKETGEAIKSIVNNLLDNVSLFGVITDTVDPAFYPVDKNGAPIAEGIYAMDGTALNAAPQDNSPYYVWTEHNGTWTIQYCNQTMPWALDEDTPGWKNEFYIKAKEDFLGGNKIPTNHGNENGITASGYVKKDTSVAPLKDKQPVVRNFDYTPYVNVDELHMEANHTEWTVYLGTEVDPATQIVNLLKEIPVKQVVKPGGTNSAGIYITGAGQMYYPHSSSSVDNDDEAAPGRNTSQTLPLSFYVDFTTPQIREKLTEGLGTLANGSDDSVTFDNIRYTEYGHAAGEFAMTVARAVNAEAKADHAPNPHETKLVGNAVERYTLTVKYTPYTNGAANTYDHTTPGGAAGQVTNGTGGNEVSSVNTHVINVIDRGIELIKTDALTGETIAASTATFRLYRALKTGETSSVTLPVGGADVPVIEVKDNLVTGGAEGANKVASLPWYKSASGDYDGQYFLKEESAPEGYLPLNKPAVITVKTANAFTDLDHDPIDAVVAGKPYNNTQTAAVTIEADGKTADAGEASGVFSVSVPNPPKGSLAVRKEVNVIGSDLALTDMDGQYAFVISGPVGAEEACTYQVILKVENNVMTHYEFRQYAGGDANPATAVPVSTDQGNVTDQSLGYVIHDIPTGIYSVKETGWTLDHDAENGGRIPANDIYLKDIVLDPPTGGNTNDVIARTTTVLVQPDNDHSSTKPLKVTFKNEYESNRYNFGVKKVWQDLEGNILPAPWDSGFSRIEFSVTRIAIPDGSEERREDRLTFGGSDTLTVQRYGRRALVKPAEPGSTSYTVEWANGGDPWQTLIAGLERKAPDGTHYTYKIEEIAVWDARGNIVTGYETTYGLSGDTNGYDGALIKEDGEEYDPADESYDGRFIGISRIDDGATAFINNKKDMDAALNLKKIVEATADEPVSGDITLTNGIYPFTITGPEGATSPWTWYVQIKAESEKIDHGENATPRYTYTGPSYTYKLIRPEDNTVPDEAAWKAIEEWQPTEDGGVPIYNLQPGAYTIIEGTPALGAIPDASGMYLESIDVPNGAHNDIDVPRQEARVYVGAGEIGSLEVVYTNKLKSVIPTVEKHVADFCDSSGDEGVPGAASESVHIDSADADIGDRIPYRVTVTLPKEFYRSAESYSLTIEDRMEHLTYQASPEKWHVYAFLKKGGQGQWVLLPDNAFTFSQGTESGMKTLSVAITDLKSVAGGSPVDSSSWAEADAQHYAYPAAPVGVGEYVEFSDIGLSANDIEKLQLRYWATLDEGANIGALGNKNDACVHYPKTNGQTGQTGWDTNRVFTYSLAFNKVDEETNGKLSNAGFQLYKKYHTASVTGLKQCAYGGYTLVGPTGTLPVAQDEEADATTTADVYVRVAPSTATEDWNFIWNGIDDGDYLLVETAAPTGYEPLKGPVSISVTATHDPIADNPRLSRVGIVATYNGSDVSGWFTDTSFPTGKITGTVPNIPYKTFKVKKTWGDGQQPPEGAEITFKLSATANGSAIAEVDLKRLTGLDDLTVTLDGTIDAIETTAWEYEWTNLPKYDGGGHVITYDASEESYTIDGQTIDLTAYVPTKDTGVEGYDAVFTNGIPTTEITVKKTWGGASWPEGILVEMTLKADGKAPSPLPKYSRTVRNDETGGAQTVISSAGAGAVWLTGQDADNGITWHDLPVYNAEGEKIVYTVTETGMKIQPESGSPLAISNWQAAFTTTPDTYVGAPDGNGVVTIDNTPKVTSIQVTKDWTENGIPRTDRTEISYALYKNTSATALTGYTVSVPENWGVAEAGKVKYIAAQSGWQTVTITELPLFEIAVDATAQTASYVQLSYYVAETGASTAGEANPLANTAVTYGLKPKPADANTAVSEGDPTATASEAATSDGQITIHNRDYLVEFEIYKMDATTMGAGQTPKYLAGARFTFVKVDETNPANPNNEAYTVTTTGEDGLTGVDGKATVTGVPAGYYRLTETTVPPGYILTDNREIYIRVADGEVTLVKWKQETEGGTTKWMWVEKEEDPKLGLEVRRGADTGIVSVGVVKIGNEPGAALPATGGTGTAPCYVGGIALILLAVLSYVLLNRKRSHGA